MSVLWAVSEGPDPALIEQAPSIGGAGGNGASRRERLGDQQGCPLSDFAGLPSENCTD
jgi:hypothetical protein